MKHILFLFFIIVSLVSCKNKTDDAIRQVGKEYYNNKTGSWIIYRVDSFVYSDFNPNPNNQIIDTFYYQVKEVIAEKFVNSSGMETNRIERYKRLNDTLEWNLTNVWTSNLTNSSLEKVEENIRYTRLSFPLAENKSWPGNQFNTLTPWEYTYKDINIPASINGHNFEKTLTVIQKDSAEDNFIEHRFAREIYAMNIGLVYKQMDTIEIQNLIKKGLYYRQTAIDWSK